MSVLEDADSRSLTMPEGRLVLAPLFGTQDAHRRFLEKALGVRLSARGETLMIKGPPERLDFAARAIRELLDLIRGGNTLFLSDIEQAVRLMQADGQVSLKQLQGRPLLTTHDRRVVHPKTPNQQRYLEAIQNHDLIFAVGPAGTGKTYLAMATAVSALRDRRYDRIILTRPAVEAGERLGFLPGTLTEKVNPYLQPLYDALFDMMGIEQAGRMVESGAIEVAPLAFMRGRTLNRAFVILDEAQNTTKEQMKMFLTRLGHDSKAVVTGDLSQTDLPLEKGCGLEHAARVLKDVEGIAQVRLLPLDIVRHPLVQAIVRAYDADEARERPEAPEVPEGAGGRGSRRRSPRSSG